MNRDVRVRFLGQNLSLDALGSPHQHAGWSAVDMVLLPHVTRVANDLSFSRNAKYIEIHHVLE